MAMWDHGGAMLSLDLAWVFILNPKPKPEVSLCKLSNC